MSAARVVQDGSRVVLVIDGKAWNLPAVAALDLAGLLQRAAMKAQEYENANRIIADGALLTRAGFPIGLTDNPKLQDAIKNEAVNNRTLRRALPGGVKSKAVFGLPAIIRGKPQ